MKNNTALLWFRQDLRLHDNEALVDAISHSDKIVPIFVFDERIFSKQAQCDFPKTDHFRLNFIIESVADLRESLKKKDVDLIIRVGKPEEEIFKLAKKLKTKWVFCNRERTHEEVKVQDALEKSLWSIGQEMRYSRGKMLYYTQDLPFPITHTPDSFKQFQKEVTRFIPIRQPLEIPQEIPNFTHYVDIGKLPQIEDFGFAPIDQKFSSKFKGGESAGLELLAKFKEEATQSNITHFSPWLSQGCLSPKTIYYAIEKLKEKDDLVQHLILRDFYRLIGKKYLNKIFIKGGIIQDFDKPFLDDPEILKKWVTGKTDEPIVNAYMSQLKQTGFISSLGRKLTGDYLVNTLKVDWRMGASYFESILIDYDPCSNWVNWNLVAGLTEGLKKQNYLMIHKKGDPNGDFIKRWLPSYESI